MSLKKRISVGWYLFADFITAAISWALCSYRHFRLQDAGPSRFLASIMLVSAGWVLLHYITGAYRDIYQKSRLMECLRTFSTTCLGTTLLFFLYIMPNGSDDPQYYRIFFLLLSVQCTLTIAARLIILHIAKYQLNKGYVKYNTLIIGANKKAIRLYKDISQRKVGLGYHISGFIYANNAMGQNGLSSYLPDFGAINNLEKIIDEQAIERVILAVEKTEQYETEKIISRLSQKDVVIQLIPDMYDILAGSVRMDNVHGAVLIEIKPGLMPDWQQHVKRIIDVTGAVTGLVLLAPLFAYIAIRVRLSSPGPVIYRQERVGYKGKTFEILKFRSMYKDAEKGTPMLSCKDDPRITAWGKIMRQWRLDELPQLWNILKGEMSFVGPRPERQYYINQIKERNPYYHHLLKVKPGLSSWGMVKFGYAENIDEMIERMRYDLIYLENISLALDLKIMIHTLLTILKRQGR